MHSIPAAIGTRSKVDRLEAVRRHLSQVIKDKEEVLKPKILLAVKKLDGLVHLASGRIVDPADGQEVGLTGNDS